MKNSVWVLNTCLYLQHLRIGSLFFTLTTKTKNFFLFCIKAGGSIKSEEKKDKEKEEEEGEEIKITNLNNTSTGFLVLKAFQTQIFSSVR